MKNILSVILLITCVMVDTACAGGSSTSNSAGLLVWLFVGFIAIFIVSQLIPGVILSFGLIKGLLTKKNIETHIQRK